MRRAHLPVRLKAYWKIEHANGGTLFLDEIEGMPSGMQVKLLRVLQERTIERLGANQLIPVNYRVIAATKEDLLRRSEEHLFRLDLYYRLNVVSLNIPPLRQRREDIPELFYWFASQAAQNIIVLCLIFLPCYWHGCSHKVGRQCT